MKKILFLSLLVLVGCSKDTIVTANSGNKIIGNYQLILQTSTDQEEFSYWGAPNLTDLTGKLSFSSDFIGYYDIIVKGENIRVNFDWSYDGGKWNLTDSNSFDWIITSSDRCDYYYCTGEANSNGLYIMMRTGFYYEMSGYKLVF